MVAAGTIDPTIILAQGEPAAGSIDASEAFDQREYGWVESEPPA